MASSHPSPVPGDIRRRVGQFLVGTFAGACALFAPRLTLMVGQPDHAAVTVVALSTTFVVGASLLSLIIGGVATILEWDGTRSPKDTFMAALGVPALLSGVFNTANVSNEAVRYADITRALADQRAKEEGIVVDDRPQSSVTPTHGSWPPVVPLVVTAYAAEQAAVGARKDQPAGVSIQYRQVRYWVVFFEDRAKPVVDQRAAALGRQYGSLTVQPMADGFAVTLGAAALPYSEAVTRAIEVKKKSQGRVTPKLVRAG